MVDVATLAVRADTTDLRDGRAELDRFTQAGARTERQMQETGRAVKAAGRSFAGASGGIRNVSLQLSQVVQQAQAGGGVLRALAIQLPDIGLGFGTIGIAAGIASGAILSFASALIEGGDEAEDYEERLSELTTAINDYEKASGLAVSTTSELREEFGRFGEDLRGTLEILQQIALSKALDTLSVAVAQIDVENLRDLVSLTESLGADFGKSSADYVFALEEIQDQYGLTVDGATELLDALNALGRAEGIQETQTATRALNDVLLRTFGTVQNIPPELRELAERAAQADVAATRLAAQLEDSADSAANLAATDFASNIAAGATEAERLADALERARGAEMDRLTNNPDFSDPRNESGTAGQVIRDRGVPAQNRPGYTAPRGRSGGGGGGGAGVVADLYLSDLESLQSQLRTEQEVLDEWYFESLEILEDRRAKEILGEQGQKDALLRLEQDYQSQLLDIQNQANDQKLGYQADFFGALASIAASGGDKLAKAAKVLGGIEATINAYRAAAQALADPTVPFWGKAAAYAATLATGLSAVASIKGAGSGGSSGPAVASSAGPAQFNPATYFNVNLVGEGNIERGSVRSLIEQLNEEIANGGQIAGITIS